MAQVVKNPPANQNMLETWVLFLFWEDPLQEEMATHSSILAREIPWMEELGRLYSPWGRKRIEYNLANKQQQNLSSVTTTLEKLWDAGRQVQVLVSWV